MSDSLKGERVWRRAQSTGSTLEETAGHLRPHPIAGEDLDDNWAWDGLPEWQAQLIGETVANELAGDLDTAGWYQTRPTNRRRLRDSGRQPMQVRRTSWLARFNPGLSLGPDAVFDESDPMTFYPWEDPMRALTWAQLSGEPYRTSQAEPYSGAHRTVVNLIADVAVGDLVFVLRTPPTDINKKSMPDPLGWRRQAHLVGVWWVEAKASYPSIDGWIYPLAYCAPLVLLDEPVPVSMAREWVPELSDVSGLRVPGGIKSVTEGQAAVLAAACSLPTEILTVDNADLPALATALRSLDTGPVQPLRRYLADATARYERTRDIELAAMVAVKDLYLNKGFAVADVSRSRRIGYDLAVGHPSCESVVMQVEVKGTDKASDTGVMITSHEFEAARESIDARNRRWWLYTVTKARHPNHRHLTVYSDCDVHPSWNRRVVNPGAAAARPLRRLDRLPAAAWQEPGGAL